MRVETNQGARCFINAAELSKALGVTRETVLRWIRLGRLPAVKVGRTIVIPEDVLDLLLAERRRDGA